MTSDTFSYPDNFNYSAYAHKVLGEKDRDIDGVLKTYNISHNTLDTMVASIQDWYSKQPHLPQGQLHNRMVIGHLIARGFSVEQAKEHIDNYFAARHKMPELLGGWYPVPPQMQRYVKEGYWMQPQLLTKEKYRVVIFRLLDPKDFVLLDAVKCSMLLRDYRMFNDPAPGEHWVLDLTKMDFNMLMQVTPTLLGQVYYYCTACYATKLKGIHLVNLPAYAHSVLAVVKKVMKQKHVSRLHLHNGFEDVFKVLPQEIFPKDLGGTSDVMSQQLVDGAYEVLMEENWQKFLAHQKKYFFTDESKRLTPVKDSYGLDGSFRKLDLD